MARRLTKDDFKQHDRRESGARTVAKGWTRRNPPRIDIVLHKEAPVYSLWRHQFARVVEVKRNDVQSVEVWPYYFNSHEDEDLLKGLLRQRDDNDRPKTPPKLCPASLLCETVRAMVNGKKLKAGQVVFKWQGDDPTRAKILTAGGLAKMFHKGMSDEMREQMRGAGLTERYAWQQSLYASSFYALARVDVDHIEDGLQVAIEKGIVGDKIREATRDRETSKGAIEGDVWINPAVIRLENFPNADKPWEKYKATIIEKINVTSEIEELISGPYPDLDEVVKPGDVHKLRLELEAHAEVDLPWDEIFGPAEEKYGPVFGGGGNEDDSPTMQEALQDLGEILKEKPLDEQYSQDDTCECDRCDATMKLDDDTCGSCGARYNLETGEMLPDEPPKPKRRRKRSAAKNSKEEDSHPDPTPDTKTANGSKPSRSSNDEDDPFDDDGDDIPWGREV